MPIPTGAKVIKDHPLSKVWWLRGYIYKWQPLHLTQNEIWCLETMYPSGFVPVAKREALEIIRMEFVKDEAPTNSTLLLENTQRALCSLLDCGIRHGDLTRPNILVRNNRPILLDFSESRLMTDPRPDKRPEGDSYWLNLTMEEIIDKNT